MLPITLTAIETKIVLLLGRGMSKPDIAASLGLQPSTVGQYIYICREKTGATSTEHLAVIVALAHEKQKRLKGLLQGTVIQ